MPSPAPDPAFADIAETRSRLIKVAEEEFALHGYAGARLQRVADRTGIRKASMYYYYKSKEDIYLAVLESIFTEVEKKARKAIKPGDSTVVMLRRVINTVVDLVASNKNYAKMLFRELLDNNFDVNRVSRLYVHPMVKLISKLLDEGAKTGVFRKVKTVQFLVNLTGMTALFVSAAPLFETIVESDGTRWVDEQEVFEERKKLLLDQIFAGLLINPAATPA